MVCLSIRVSISVLFISVLQVSGYGSLASLDTRFIPRYFIIFVAELREIVALICLPGLSLLACKYARGFCVSFVRAPHCAYCRAPGGFCSRRRTSACSGVPSAVTRAGFLSSADSFYFSSLIAMAGTPIHVG